MKLLPTTTVTLPVRLNVIIQRQSSLFTLVMRPQDEGLLKEDVQRILSCGWDASVDEESEDEMRDVSAVLEQNLEQIMERGESVDIGLPGNIVLVKKVAVLKILGRKN